MLVLFMLMKKVSSDSTRTLEFFSLDESNEIAHVGYERTDVDIINEVPSLFKWINEVAVKRIHFDENNEVVPEIKK